MAWAWACVEARWGEQGACEGSTVGQHGSGKGPARLKKAGSSKTEKGEASPEGRGAAAMGKGPA